MKCARCGADSNVLDTRLFEYGTTVRRRQCFNGHRFQSIEIYRECYGSTRERCKTYFTVTVARYRAMWERNKDIARSIAAGVSWEVLAKKYELSRTSVYLALRAGRSNVPYSSRDKLREYARPLKTPAVLPDEPGGPKTVWRAAVESDKHLSN